MIATAIPSCCKAKIEDSLWFTSGNKALGSILYHDNVDSESLHIPKNENRAYYNSISL